MARKKSIDTSLTLEQLSERYLAHMQKAGKSPGTTFSYAMELRLAGEILGKDTLASTITLADIERFNRHPRVVKLKSGKPRAEPTVAKARRIIRLAFAWAMEEGLIEASPYAAPATDAPVEPAKPTKPRRRRGVELEVAQPVAEAAADAVEPSLTDVPTA